MSKVRNPHLYFIEILLLLAISFGLVLYFNSQISLIYVFFISINIAAFLLCAFDKSAALSERLRVPEKVLLFSALIGGSAGVLIGMALLHHKTSKWSFQFFLGLVLLVQVVVIQILLRGGALLN